MWLGSSDVCVTQQMAQRSTPYGSWKSPVSAEMVAAGGVDLRHGLARPAFDGPDLYWIEGRPAEGGRNVIVRRSFDRRTTDVLPVPFDARTRVHEYGGGDFTVCRGILYFANRDDQRLYRLGPGQPPHPLTAATSARYADMIIDEERQRLLCVREDHSAAGSEPTNTIVSVDLRVRTEPNVLCAGHDFYAAPRLSPAGRRMAWLTWDHPHMPWDGSDLWVADVLADGSLGPASHVAGGPDESIVQPEWSPSGVLHFVSDRSGYWNLYRQPGDVAEPMCAMAADFAVPQWSFDASTYAFESADRIVCCYTTGGRWQLASIDARSGTLDPIVAPYTDISYLRASAGCAVFCAGSPTVPYSVVRYDLAAGTSTVLRCSKTVTLDSGYISQPEPLTYPTSGGAEAHAFFYPPTNRDHLAPPSERPPLLVMSHGGPTSVASIALELKVQFWTSRGFAVLDVNYRGSSGYGRAYRRALDGCWGVADVDDCIYGGRYLVAGDRVDGRRLLIRGGSAAGFTTLCALTFHDVFRAGASYYGISDLEALATETHKFEARYLDRLVGPYPQCRDVYRERSPLYATDRLSCPVIVFQGLDDKVVLPNQAERLVAALRAKGLPVAYVPFAGEQHGFRRAETVRRALEAELYFYSRVLGFELADPVEGVEIENL